MSPETADDEAAGVDAAAAAQPQPALQAQGYLVYLTAIVLAAIWLVLDQATKTLAVAALDSGTVSLGLVDLHVVRNEAGAFGLDPGLFPGLFIVVTLAVVVLIARALPRTDRLSLATAYGLIGGGALGNLVDRVLRPSSPASTGPGFPEGAVVDFVDLGWWPVFNLADVGIVAGAVVLALLLVKVDRQERALERAAERERAEAERQRAAWERAEAALEAGPSPLEGQRAGDAADTTEDLPETSAGEATQESQETGRKAKRAAKREARRAKRAAKRGGKEGEDGSYELREWSRPSGDTTTRAVSAGHEPTPSGS